MVTDQTVIHIGGRLEKGYVGVRIRQSHLKGK